MLLQLNPPIPVITPKGEGLAHVLIDYGIESDLMWTVFLTCSGECWKFANPQIRACKNISVSRFLEETNLSNEKKSFLKSPQTVD